MVTSTQLPETTKMLSLKYALQIVGLMIAYFAIMAVAGWYYEPWLYTLNFLFLIYGINASYKHTIQQSHPHFFTLLINGIIISNLVGVLYAGFIMIYSGLLNPHFLAALQENANFGSYINPYSVGIVTYTTLTMGGIFIGYVSSLFYLEETGE